MTLPDNPDPVSPSEAVQKEFDSFASRHLYTLTGEYSNDTRLLIQEICKRPEFRPLLDGVRFRVASSGTGAFRTEGDDFLELNLTTLDSPPLAAFCIRYGLELLMLRRRLAGRKDALTEIVRAVMGLHTAACYLDGMIDHEKLAVKKHLSPPLLAAIESIMTCAKGNESPDALADAVAPHLECLLPLQSAPVAFDAPSVHEGCHIISDMLVLARPTERLLTLGGDNRLIVDNHTGLNQYGCSPRPRPWAITFSSCTASSISDIGYQEAERSRQLLIAQAYAQGFAPVFSASTARVRSEIARVLRLDLVPGAEVILTPSGTDAELYALHVAMGLSRKPVLNIVISSIEIGSGAIHAAGGRYFDGRSPLGGDVACGAPIEGFDVDNVTVEAVEIRHKSGNVKRDGGMESHVESLAGEAVGKGKAVLLHLLDSSKTGVGGPSIESVIKLKKTHGPDFFVTVDAAQMRLGRDFLRVYLEHGFMVMITGSKFFTGPPFAGALLVPPELTARFQDLPPFPAGLAAYASKYDLPDRWAPLGQRLSQLPNVGLWLRWCAALWEMKAFYSVPPSEQFRTIKTFGEAILKAIDGNADLQLVSAPLHDRGQGPDRFPWDQLPSIFTFMVLRKDPRTGQTTPLTYEETRAAYRYLNMDIGRFLPVNATDRDHNLAAKRGHIGQPVRIMHVDDVWIGALRIAAGARLVSGVRHDPALGRTPEQRLGTEIQTACAILEKLSVIVKYWDHISQFDLSDSVTPGAGFYLF